MPVKVSVRTSDDNDANDANESVTMLSLCVYLLIIQTVLYIFIYADSATILLFPTQVIPTIVVSLW